MCGDVATVAAAVGINAVAAVVMGGAIVAVAVGVTAVAAVVMCGATVATAKAVTVAEGLSDRGRADVCWGDDLAAGCGVGGLRKWGCETGAAFRRAGGLCQASAVRISLNSRWWCVCVCVCVCVSVCACV